MESVMGPSRATVAETSVDAIAAGLLADFDQIPVDRASIPQDRLDLVNRYRTSLFPWRGQFSPELVELFLSEFTSARSVIADPFVGSGTTLFEAARKSLRAFGAEINPAAVVMSRTVHFANLELGRREEHIRAAESLIETHLPVHYAGGLFSSPGGENGGIAGSFRAMLSEAAPDSLTSDILANTIMRFMESDGPKDTAAFWCALKAHAEVIRSLPFTPNPCKVFHCDARELPLESRSIDLVVTSPPYINVFNYHQNHRPAMETLGWNLLEVARSEFGSNRKNRGNRFLTVVQYAMDMLQALAEVRRLVAPDGRIILIIGRESTVRGISFKDGRIVAALATGGADLQLALRQERKFKTKFGETIYEDILHFVPEVHEPRPSPDGFARGVAQVVLDEKLGAAQADIRRDILDAIREAPSVLASPRFKARKDH
jgi:SAM-dependent methyltransferase